MRAPAETKKYGSGTSKPGRRAAKGPRADHSGELHSYAQDELGVVTASSHPTVRSAAGFVVMALFFAAVAVFSILLVAGPTSQGQDPLWGALILTAAGVGGAVYSARLAGIAAKARRLRAQRGIPEPTARQFD